MKLQPIYDTILNSIEADKADVSVFPEMLKEIFAEYGLASGKGSKQVDVICVLRDSYNCKTLYVKKLYIVLFCDSEALHGWLKNIGVEPAMFISAMAMHIQSYTKLPIVSELLSRIDYSNSSIAWTSVLDGVLEMLRPFYVE